MPWSKQFNEPIILSDGRQLHTLRDAVHYITDAEYDAAEWQLAMKALMLVAERDAPEMLARTAIMRAMNMKQPEA